MATYDLGWMKGNSGRDYEVIWDEYKKIVYAKYTSSGFLSSSSHYEIGKAYTPEEAMMKARAWGTGN